MTNKQKRKTDLWSQLRQAFKGLVGSSCRPAPAAPAKARELSPGPPSPGPPNTSKPDPDYILTAANARVLEDIPLLRDREAPAAPAVSAKLDSVEVDNLLRSIEQAEDEDGQRLRQFHTSATGSLSAWWHALRIKPTNWHALKAWLQEDLGAQLLNFPYDQ